MREESLDPSVIDRLNQIAQDYYWNHLSTKPGFESYRGHFETPEWLFTDLAEGSLYIAKYVLYITPLNGSSETNQALFDYLHTQLGVATGKAGTARSRMVFKDPHYKWDDCDRFAVNGSLRELGLLKFPDGTIALYGRFLVQFLNVFYLEAARKQKLHADPQFQELMALVEREKARAEERAIRENNTAALIALLKELVQTFGRSLAAEPSGSLSRTSSGVFASASPNTHKRARSEPPAPSSEGSVKLSHSGD